MPLIIAVPKYARIGEGFTRREMLQALEHPGRRTDGTQSAATWVTDLVDRKKVIVLCAFCRGKFNPRRNRYRRFYVPDVSGRTDGHTANGQCEVCKQPSERCGGGTAYISEETYQLACIDPMDARRQARQRARALGAWPSFWARVRQRWGSSDPLEVRAQQKGR